MRRVRVTTVSLVAREIVLLTTTTLIATRLPSFQSDYSESYPMSLLA
jgi:hypothetical protein